MSCVQAAVSARPVCWCLVVLGLGTVFNLQLEQAAAPPVSPGPCGLCCTGVSMSLSQKWRR